MCLLAAWPACRVAGLALRAWTGVPAVSGRADVSGGLVVVVSVVRVSRRRSLLPATKMVLIRKITLFALAEAIKQSADDDEQMHAMLGVAVELLAMPLNVLVIEAIR